MPTNGPVGERIAIYRRRRGLSQAVLAGLIGRSVSWLSQVERGTRAVDRMSVHIDAHTVKAVKPVRSRRPGPRGRRHLKVVHDAVFSTVGFGDITAKTEATRLVVTGQMIADLVIIGVAVPGRVRAAAALLLAGAGEGRLALNSPSVTE